MAIYYEAPVTPDELTAFLREVPVDDGLVLVNAAPVVSGADNTVRFSELVRLRRTARYRAYDGRIHVSSRDVGTRSELDLLPLSSSLNMGEYERLAVEFAKVGGTNEAALAQAIYNDGENLVGEIWARLEQATGDVLANGALQIPELGDDVEADFGVPADMKPTPAKLWTDPTALIWSDLLAWGDIYTAHAGTRAGVIRTDSATLRLVRTNAEVIDAVYGAGSGRSRVTMEDLNTALADEGLPIFAAPNDVQVDVDGTLTRTVPAGQVVFTPFSLADIIRIQFGLTATALELVQSSEAELGFVEAPGIAGVVEKVGPPYRQFTFVDAVAMPILTAPRRLLTANVGSA